MPLRERLGVHDEALLFIYLGGLGRGRGIEIALKAFSDVRVQHHVLFMGSGPLQYKIDAASSHCSRIHYLPPVSPSQVLAYAAGADVGLCLYEDTCLNHRYCMPNKLFESLLAGLPVLASDLPDQACIVRKHNSGWGVSKEPSVIANFLVSLSREDVEKVRDELPKRVKTLRWENEAKQLLCLYKKLLSYGSGNVRYYRFSPHTGTMGIPRPLHNSDAGRISQGIIGFRRSISIFSVTLFFSNSICWCAD